MNESSLYSAETATENSSMVLFNGSMTPEDPSDMVIFSTWRVPPHMAIVYTIFYAAIFFMGLIGNSFVLIAVIIYNSLRSATDFMIASLALADLLVVIFCLPTTLLNNLLTEWQLGSYGCKLSTFINSTTSCASVFTLVGVTADRYLAICHSLKYSVKGSTNLILYFIAGVWLISAVLASPNLFIYDQILYRLLPTEDSPVARLCVSTRDDFLLFVIVNLIIAFLVPVCVICVSYTLIFRRVTKHTKQKLAVDNNARYRDERVKIRIAQMMLTVVVVFVVCWTPLYVLYCYFFLASNRESKFFHMASSVLRPLFQWLSLLSSSLNPLIYIAFSQKYRRAFHSLLLLPCRHRYEKFQQVTRQTFRFSSCTLTTPQQGVLQKNERSQNLNSVLSSDRRYMSHRSFDATSYYSTNCYSLDGHNNHLRKSSLQVLPNKMVEAIRMDERRQKSLESPSVNKFDRLSPLCKKIMRSALRKSSSTVILTDSKKDSMITHKKIASKSTASAKNSVQKTNTNPLKTQKQHYSGVMDTKMSNPNCLNIEKPRMFMKDKKLSTKRCESLQNPIKIQP